MNYVCEAYAVRYICRKANAECVLFCMVPMTIITFEIKCADFSCHENNLIFTEFLYILLPRRCVPYPGIKCKNVQSLFEYRCLKHLQHYLPLEKNQSKNMSHEISEVT